VDVRSLGGAISGSNRAFESFGRFNDNARIRLWSAGNISLTRPGGNSGFNPVVDSAGSGGRGGANELRSHQGGITVGANALVTAAGSPNGTNLLTSCAGVTNNGTVTPAALVSGACAPLAPPSLFTDCSTFGILFPLNQ
jgi:hypothetical protein